MERGMTLTELTIVMVIAALVTVGLVTFYINSQSLWMDASTQAMTQRDATLLLERLTRAAREAPHTEVANSPDSLHQMLILRDSGNNERLRFAWEPGDSLVHEINNQTTDMGPVATSRVERFQLETDDSTFVALRGLWMRTANGERVELSSTIALYNR